MANSRNTPARRVARRRNAVVAPAPQKRAGRKGGGGAAPARLPRVAKGRRAQFHSDPATDQLFAIVTALTAELSVAFERIATLEQLLEMGGTLRRDAIEAHRPEGEEAEARRVAREALVARVFQVLEAYAGEPD